jgi:hypothetical protein
MRSLALALLGLQAGVLASAALGGGCCASTSTMPPGVYHSPGAEPDYSFELSGNGMAVESYTRNGRKFVVAYRATSPG